MGGQEGLGLESVRAGLVAHNFLGPASDHYPHRSGFFRLLIRSATQPGGLALHAARIRRVGGESKGHCPA